MKFYAPTNSERKVHKARIENWLTIGFELGSPTGNPQLRPMV